MSAAIILATPVPALTWERRHADRDRYRCWLLAHHTYGVRYNRLQVYDAFVAQRVEPRGHGSCGSSRRSGDPDQDEAGAGR